MCLVRARFMKIAFIVSFLVVLFILTFRSSCIAQDRSNNTLPGKVRDMFIEITANGRTTVYKLNNSQASKEFFVQLPLALDVEDYGSKEKIFYPPKKLVISNTPKANAGVGTLAYYAPWGNVVMFYERFGSASGLYELGEVVSGKENISKMSGRIQIEKTPITNKGGVRSPEPT